MKVAFLSEVNKSRSRKLLTHSELSLSERSENSRFTRSSLFYFLTLPSSFDQGSNKALFAENMHTARACESAGALADHQKRECPLPLRSSRAVKAPSRILCERELAKLKPPRCPKCATFGQFSLAAPAKSGT